MAGYWLKLYTEILDDPKYFRLSDNAKLGMIELMLVAKKFNKNGEIPTIEDVAFFTRRSIEWWKPIFDELLTIEYLVTNGSETIIRKFAERQAAVSDSERQKQHRIVTHKNEYCHEAVTKSNGDSETDSETDSDEKAKIHSLVLEYFIQQSKLPIPENLSYQQKTEKWFDPIADICELINYDPDKAKQLIDSAIKKYDSGDLKFPIASPKSIRSIAIGLAGKKKRDSTMEFRADEFLAEEK